MQNRYSLVFKKVLLNQCLIPIVAWLCFACATTKESSHGAKENSDGENSEGGKGDSAGAEEEQLRVSEKYSSLLTTLKPTPLVPYNVNSNSLSSLKSNLLSALQQSGRGQPSLAVYANLLSIMRLGRDSSKEMLNVAEQYVADLMKRKPDANLPDTMKLDLALSALARGEYGFAEFYLGELIDSKSKDVKSTALVAQGLVYYQDDMIPEAVQYWQKALEVDPKNSAAHLNLGLTALNYGDFSAAQTHLASFTDDWFGQFLLITVHRFSGKGSQAYSDCNRILLKQSKYKPLYYNCALVAYQSENQAEQAIKWLEEYDRIPPSPAAFDQKARELRMAIADAKKEPARAKPEQNENSNEGENKKDGAEKKKDSSPDTSRDPTGANAEGFD